MRRQAPTEDLRQRVIDSIPLRRMGNAAEHRRVGAGRRLCQRSRPGHRFVKRGLLNPTVRAESLAMVRREHDEGVLAQPRGVERTLVSGLDLVPTMLDYAGITVPPPHPRAEPSFGRRRPADGPRLRAVRAVALRRGRQAGPHGSHRTLQVRRVQRRRAARAIVRPAHRSGRSGQPGGSRFGACCAIGSERQRTTSRYPRDMAGKRTRLPAPRKRNWSAQKARDQKAGPMKDRRTPRGGAKNTFREDIEQSRQ